MTQASSARDRASHFDLVVFVLAILGCGFFALAPRVHLAPIQVKGEPLRPFSSNEPALAGSGFAKDAVFSVVATPPTVSGVELYGSAVQGDASTGVVHTRWYLPVERFDILLAGYPLQPGESIGLEIEDQKSELHEQPIVPADNPETWSIRRIVLKNFRDARRFRIAAEDLSTKPLGWIGFSEPFVMNQFKYLLVLKQLGLAILCAAGCMVAFLGPGFLLRAYGPRFRSPVWLPLPGLIGMCLLGLLAWKAPSSLTPQSIVRIPLLLGSFVFLLFLARRRLSSLTTPVERSVLMIVWLLIALAVGKSVYSEGPAGELYRGQISRTLEANGRGDSRISFHVVQLVGLRQNAYSELSERLFSPWNFSHRGVVAGLATSPIVLATQALVPGSPPHATWSVFDPQGFTAYRIAVIVMSSVSLLILFGLAQCFLPDDWAFLAFLVTALAPFTIHEIFFTWPKILAEAFVLLAAYLVKTRRYFAAGCAIGIGYLYHPSALLWSPAVLVTVFLLNGSRSAWFSRLKNSAASAMRLVAGLSVFLLGWHF